MTIEASLEYELTPLPLSLFSNKDHKMNKANKAIFSNTSLKVLTDPLDLTDQPCSSLVVDGGWLLYMVKWEQGHTWQEIADSYLSYVQYLGRYFQKITVVFDGYSSSPKDHDHIRHTKNSCCDVQIRPNMMHLTPRAKFLDNTHNKSEIIHLLSSAFQKHQITIELCDNDADTSIVKAALAAAKDDSVEVSEPRGWLLCCYSISYYFQVRAEDANVLIMLIHHSSYTNHPLFFTTSKGSYDFRRIQESLSQRQRRYLLFCNSFTGCDTVSAIASHGKTTLFDRFCAGDIFLSFLQEYWNKGRNVVYRFLSV